MMTSVVFGFDGKSDKSVGGRIFRSEDLDIVGCIEVHQLKECAVIGAEIQPVEENEVLARWVFFDMDSIDVVIKQLNAVKEKMIEEKALYDEH